MIAQERILKLKESKNTKELLRNLRLIEEGEQRLMPATQVELSKQETGSSSRLEDAPRLFSKPIGINIPIYSSTIVKTKPDYIKDFPTSDKSFTPVKTMASQAINPVGIYLNLDNVQDRKKALDEWPNQMNMCFASNEQWDASSCKQYAEQSIRGIAKDYLDSLRKATDEDSLAKVEKMKENLEERSIEEYIQLFTSEFIGAGHLDQINEQGIEDRALEGTQRCAEPQF